MASTNFLSKESFKLLKHFSKVTSIAPPESNTLPEDCLDQLVSSAFVTRSVSTIDVDTMTSEFSYAITEDGKGYLRYLKNKSRKKWIPYTITTVISVLALMKSYGHGIDDIILWCMQRLMR